MGDQFVATVKVGAAMMFALGATGMAGATAAAASDDLVGQGILGTALLATAGAFMFIVKKMADGSLVHRDNTQALERITIALERTNHLVEQGHIRETAFMRLLLEQHPAPGETEP